MTHHERPNSLSVRKQEALRRQRNLELTGNKYGEDQFSRTKSRMTQLVIGAAFAMTTIGLGLELTNNEPETNLTPDPAPHLLQPGERLVTIADEACENIPREEVLNFILDMSGISVDQIGTLQPGTPLVVPLNGSC